MEEGYIVLKYDLGSGSITLKSSEKLNDGKWHSLEATRVDREAILKVIELCYICINLTLFLEKALKCVKNQGRRLKKANGIIKNIENCS